MLIEYENARGAARGVRIEIDALCLYPGDDLGGFRQFARRLAVINGPLSARLLSGK